MPLQDLPEGKTHSQNDGCGEPAHNPEIPMGVSQWKAAGQKYQYDKYFGVVWPKETIQEPKATLTCMGLSCPERNGGKCDAGEKIKSFLPDEVVEDAVRFATFAQRIKKKYWEKYLNDPDKFPPIAEDELDEILLLAWEEMKKHKANLLDTPLRDKLDELFPKGKCAERGAALVLFAEFQVWVNNKNYDPKT